MPETIVGPDVEALVVGFLNGKVGPPVSSNIPNPRPATFVRATLSGGEGVADKGMYRALVTLEAWAPGRPAAFALLAECCGHLEASQAFYADCGAPSFFPDPSTGSPRYVTAADMAVPVAIL